MAGQEETLNAVQRMFRFTGMEKGRGRGILVVMVGFTIGCIIDRSESHHQTTFRDRSALYGRELKEGEPPSWPSRDQYWN